MNKEMTREQLKEEIEKLKKETERLNKTASILVKSLAKEDSKNIGSNGNSNSYCAY